MKRRMIVEPCGWPCSLSDCPPGHFVRENSLCFKTEYGAMETDAPVGKPGSKIYWTVGSRSDAYNECGERFWGGVGSKEEVEKLIVQPVEVTWEEY